MTRPSRWLSCLVAFAAAASGSERMRPATVRGLQMHYPADWQRTDDRAPDTLTIVKPFIAYHGGVLPRGQLQIWVAPSNAPDPSLAGSITHFTSQGQLRDERLLHFTGGHRSCATMSERVVADEVVPPENHEPGPRSILNDLLFCVLDGRTYVGDLQVWEKDTRAAGGRRVLIEVMRSLRPKTHSAPSSHQAP